MDRTRLLTPIFLLSLPVGGATACFWPGVGGDDPAPEPAGIPGEPLPPPPAEPEPSCPPPGGIAYERAKPNVMFLVDRSGSMSEPGQCDGGSCPSKWQQLLALGGYLADIKGLARLGLTVFPSTSGELCGVEGGTVVELSENPDTDQRILEQVSRMTPGGRTPIASALDQLEQTGGLDDPERDNVIVLLTDGSPNCMCDSSGVDCERDAVLAAIGRLRERVAPIRLNVIGFGASAATAHETLSAMAVAAGTARPDGTAYWQANTAEELVTRLYEIAASLASCRFALDEVPEADHLIVHLDDVQVPACFDEPCTSGYTFDATAGTVELHGDTCRALRDGACHNVWFEDTAAP